MKEVDWESAKESISLVGTIPEIIPDNTDRNRTSPFAFTGNRFEFRALGSSANPASATFVLNAIVADSLRQFADRVDSLTASGEDSEKAILATIRDFLIAGRKVLFEGNGYSREWQEESARRGLRPVNNAAEAYHAFQEPDSVAVLTDTGVLSSNEIDARVEVFEETFVKKLQIEARVIGDICLNHIIPAATAYLNVLATNLSTGRDVFGDEAGALCRASGQTYRKIAGLINSLSDAVAALVEERRKANHIPDISERARLYSTAVMDAMNRVRESADNLEMLVDDAYWPLPKYRELLYL